jgi:hypothetical protein
VYDLREGDERSTMFREAERCVAVFGQRYSIENERGLSSSLSPEPLEEYGVVEYFRP